MNKSDFIRFAVIPGVVLLAVSLIRVQLEFSDPDGAVTHAVSANYPSLLILALWPFLMLRRGWSLKRFMGMMAATFALARLPIAAIYGMAVAQSWEVESTGAPTRYMEQGLEISASPVIVFLVTLFVPFTGAMVISFISWSVTWALRFRGSRPFSEAPSAS